MITRNKGTGWSQALKWDSHNRLAQMTGSGVSEGYLYDESGQRIRKKNLLNSVSTFYPFPGYERTSSGVVRKHYSFNGVAMAVRTGSGSPYLLYQDGVHSTAYVTDLNGNVTAQRGYYAFGPLRRSTGTMPTDRRFTGQQEDATGIYYFNSRYYDAQISQFISPDTIVPDEKNFLSYNRYLYALGNPLKYNDPSGHCAVRDNGQPDENDGECWTAAWTIYQMWDETDYWQRMWPEGKDHFIKNVATQPITANWFQDEMMRYYASDEYKDYRAAHPLSGTTHTFQLDPGDYTSINATYFVIDGSLTIDDFGQVFLRLGPAIGVPGISVVRGQVSVISDPNMNLLDATLGKATATDIDQLGLSDEEKRQLMKDLMVGESQSFSIGGRYVTLGVGQGRGIGTLEMGVTGKSYSFTIAPRSYTMQLR